MGKICDIPYIDNAPLSNTEKERLEKEHIAIFKEAKKFGAFRREGDRFVTLKNEYPKATQFVSRINENFQQIVATLPSIGGGKHSLNVNVLPLAIEQQFPLLQKEGTEPKEVSSQVVKLAKEFLKKIGVDYEEVKEISVNGKKIGANGAAFLTQKLVQVVHGKESEALPEEAMHFAVAILKQTNPKLYQKLLSEVNGYEILNEVFADYGDLYKTPEGKPDVLKLKEEAIAKVLVEIIINKSKNSAESPQKTAKAQSWWQQILDFLKGLFTKSGFDIAAIKILSGEEIGTAEDIRDSGEMFQVDKQSKLIEKLKDISSQINKKDEEYYFNGKKIAKRVTSLIKDWYSKRFENSELTKSEFAKAVDDLKAEKGTAGHADFEHAFEVFVDENGLLRKEPLEDAYTSKINPENNEIYDILKENLRQRLLTFPAGTKFLKEITLFDPKRNLAGTIDFLAITPQGKVNILDWKFMDLNTTKYDDVPWYKVNAWRQQMEQYKLILEKVYGVKYEDFEQTRMIPIKVYYSEGNKTKEVLPKLLSVEIGDVNVQNITDDYLVPVGLEEEKTGSDEIDKLLEKLNALYAKLSDKKVSPEGKIAKAEQLNSLFKAIRQLQMKRNVAPLIAQAKILNKQIKGIINNYEDNWNDKDAEAFSDDQIESFSEEIQTAENALRFYTNIDIELGFIFIDNPDDPLSKELDNTAKEAKHLLNKLASIDKKFNSEIVSKKEGIENDLSPEKVIKGFTRWFSTTATQQMRSMEVLYKKVNRILKYASMDTLDETKKLQDLEKAYKVWANSKGLSNKNYFDIIKKKDKNELIDEFKPEYYKELKTKIKDKDIAWIKENIDIDQHKKNVEEVRDREVERIKNKARIGTEAEIQAEINKEVFKIKELYNTSTSTSPGWLIYDLLKKSPKRSVWETSDWKELHKDENKPALAFYEYIIERNFYYKSLGYLNQSNEARVFLPFIRKGLMEKLVSFQDPKLGEEFLRSISVDEGDIGYGQTDPLTGELVNTIPKYFISKLEGDISVDLFRNMALYNEMAIKFKYLDTIDSTIQGLVNTERNKKAIATSFFGKTVYKNGKLQYNPNNDENSELLEDMMKAIVYGQKFLKSETFDQLLGSLSDFGERANKKLGIKIFPENLEGRQVSVNKVINQLNNTFQLNALGLNPLSALSNFLGGSFQSAINAGTYFTKSEVIATELWLAANKMTGGEDQRKMIAALEYFLPLTDNYNKEVAKTLSLNSLSQENIQEFLMILMRKSDWFVQTTNFYTFLKNSVVVDGKVVNAREYVRSLPEYSDMYGEDRKEKKEKYEEDVKKLIEEKGVLKLSEVKNGVLTIPGVDRKDNSVIELSRKVQQINNDALGNLSEDNVRKINLLVAGKSFMLFKNWIPRLVDVRTGNLKYNSASDAYEWGRMRMVFRLLAQNTLESLDSLKSSITGNDQKWINQMKALYEAKSHEYKEDTGKDLKMTQSEFMDLVNKNIKNQITDTIFMLTLLALFWGLKANMPDDDEDERVKNGYKYLLRATDKIKDELAYFYDPTSFTSLVSSGIFPSISYINNFKKLVVNFGIENYAIAIGDEKLEKDTKVIKYLMKSFPITNQAAGVLPVLYPELAKELGLKPQSQARPMGL